MKKTQISSEFISINIALLTISDSRTIENDKSGNLLQERIISIGHNLKERNIIKDDFKLIKQTFINLSNDPLIDAIISTGGTGLTGRDSTPEAVIELSEKMIDGFGELFRALSYQEIGSSAMLTRACAGTALGKILISIPGSENAVRLAMEKLILPELGHLVREVSR